MSVTLAIVSISLTVMGFLFLWFGVVSRILQRLTKVETRGDLFWKIVEDKMVEVFHSPEHPRRDELMDRWRDKQLGLEEAIELRLLVNHAFDLTNGDDPRKMAAALILGKLEQDIVDLEEESCRKPRWTDLLWRL